MKNSILTAVVVIITTISAFSQSITETRHIKSTAFQIYENYKVVMSGLYSRSSYTEDYFMALFDSSAVIYNDIIPANTPAQLSPSEYFEKFKANINRIYPVFSDFKMGDPVSVGNKWQIQCSFTRATRFRTQKDMKYPEWSFNYTMTIEMDQSYNDTNKVCENAKIVSVEVDHPLEKFFVIENKENIPLTSKSGETLNDWDEEYQSRIFPVEKWKISDINVPESIINENIFEYSKGKLSKNDTDAYFYQTDIQRFKKDFVGIGASFSPLAFGNKMSKDFKNFKPTSSALSFSLFYGKQVFHKEKATGFVNFGLDLNRYSYKYSGINDTIKYSDDKDRDGYSHKIIVNWLNEKKVNFTSMAVPVSFEYVRQLTEQTKNPIFLSFELGVFAEFRLSSKSGHILTAVYYSDSFDVSLTQQFACGIFGGVGLWYVLNKNSLIKFNVSYKQSLNSPLKYNEDPVISKLQSTNHGNIYFGISWVRMIEGKGKYLKIKSIFNN